MSLVLDISVEWPKQSVGSKARVLQQLINTGYAVPPLVVLPSTTVKKLETDTTLMQDIVSEITTGLNVRCYAVRSAAFDEDAQTVSSAGRFKTLLAVSEDRLAEAIFDVVKDAASKVSLSQFSIIVQEFVEPERSGVLFTRNPQGGLESVIESRPGRGDRVVAGDSVEECLWLPGDKIVARDWLNKLGVLGQAFEKQFAWPQDIEWAFADGKLHVLQSRPITTIDVARWLGVQAAAETELADNTYLKQTALSEVFIKPTPLAFSILKALYHESGPVYDVYRKAGLRFLHFDKPKLICGTVFTDAASELRTFLPAFRLVSSVRRTLTLSQPRNVLLSLRNTVALLGISTRNPEWYRDQLVSVLKNNNVQTDSLAEWWPHFLQQYELVFATSVRCEKALQSLQLQLKNSSLLSQIKPQSIREYLPKEASNWVGNSISIDDTSPFQTTDASATDIDNLLVTTDVSAWRKPMLRKQIAQYQIWQQNKELSRALSVQLINQLRSVIEAKADALDVEEALRSYLTLQEYLDEDFSAECCAQRQYEHEKNAGLTLPKNLYTSTLFKSENTSENLAISAGNASGTLVSLAEVDVVSEPKILLVEQLSPDLVHQFPKIVGIVGQTGGQLSHLAILAREAGMPAVVAPQITSTWLGESVMINGTNGIIEKNYE